MGFDIQRYTMSMAPENQTLSRAMYRGIKDCHYSVEVPISNVSISFDKSAGIARIHEQFEMVEEPGKSADRINFLFSEARKPNGRMWFLILYSLVAHLSRSSSMLVISNSQSPKSLNGRSQFRQIESGLEYSIPFTGGMKNTIFLRLPRKHKDTALYGKSIITLLQRKNAHAQEMM
jgi:hypothetical protein